MRLSVVIPVHNESGNIEQLLKEVDAALTPVCTHEVIVVDDCSTDGGLAALLEIQKNMPTLRIIHHQECCGQSTALMTGIDLASYEYVATLDGDGQNDPADLPGMIDRIEADPAEAKLWMIAGFRQCRRDSWWRLFCSRIANGVRSRILGDATPDTGCGIKLFRRDVFSRMPHFNHMHRFLPSLVIREGGRVVSVPVNHRARIHGRSHYGTLRRLACGIVDLAGVAWLMRRKRLPVIVQMDASYDDRREMDSIRLDGAAAVHRPISRAVA